MNTSLRASQRKSRRGDSTREGLTIIILEDLKPNLKGGSDIHARISALASTRRVRILAGVEGMGSLFKNVEIVTLPRGNKKGGSIFFYFCCWLLLLIYRYDRIFLSEISSSPAILTAKRGRVICYGNTNIVQRFSIHENEDTLSLQIRRWLYLALCKLSFKRIWKILAISGGLEKTYLSAGIRNDSIKVQFAGVDLMAFRPIRNAPKDFFRCIYTGDLTENRGARELLLAIEIVVKKIPAFRFRIVGSRPDKLNEFIESARERGVEDCLETIGSIPHNEIPSHLNISHIGISLLHPTEYYMTSPPTKIFEYMASGLPVVANDIPTHSDFIENRQNGLLTSLEPISIADAIFELASNDELYQKLSKRAVLDSKNYDLQSLLVDFLEEFK